MGSPPPTQGRFVRRPGGARRGTAAGPAVRPGEEDSLPSEQRVRDAGAGAGWTILRASWFCQNFDEHYLLEPVLSGLVALPAGEVAEPFIDADDIAEVAVAALTRDGHANRIYELTG